MIAVDGDPRVLIVETRKGNVLWQKVISPDEAAFLSMDVDEVLRSIRHQMPSREGA
jgi:hypothetical protein